MSATTFKIDRHTIVSNILALFSGSALAQAAAMLTVLVMARQLGPEQYGQYSGSLTLATFASILFSLGLDLWLLREGGATPAKINLLSGSVLFLRASIGIAWLVIMFLIAPLLRSSSFPAEIVRLSALTVWLSALFTTILTTFKAILRNKVSAVLEAALNIVILLATLALAAKSVNQVNIYLAARILALALGVIAGAAAIHQFFRLKVSRETARTALRQSPPYAASEFLAWLFLRLDVLLVATILGDRATGLYSPAVGLLNALFLVPAAVHLVLVPVLSNLFVSHPQQAWKTARRAVAVQFLVGLVMALGIYFGAGLITLILGEAYAGTETVLKMLSPIIFFQSLTYGVAAVLVAANLQAKRSLVQAITIATDAVLNLLLLPRLGISGAAIAYLVSSVVLLGGYSLVAFQKYRQTAPAN